MTNLPHMSPGEAVKDIAEGAAVTYWFRKRVTDSTDDSKGKLFPTIKVRNDTEWAATWAGANIAMWWAIKICFWVIAAPVLLVTFLLLETPAGIVGLATHHHQPVITAILACIGLVIWGYFILWRLVIKKWARRLIFHGPVMEYVDGYQGPLRTKVH